MVNHFTELFPACCIKQYKLMYDFNFQRYFKTKLYWKTSFKNVSSHFRDTVNLIWRFIFSMIINTVWDQIFCKTISICWTYLWLISASTNIIKKLFTRQREVPEQIPGHSLCVNRSHKGFWTKCGAMEYIKMFLDLEVDVHVSQQFFQKSQH